MSHSAENPKESCLLEKTTVSSKKSRVALINTNKKKVGQYRKYAVLKKNSDSIEKILVDKY